MDGGKRRKKRPGGYTGGLTIRPAQSSEEDRTKFRQEQDMLNAEVRAASTAGFQTRTYVASTGNVMVTELWTEGEENFSVAVDFRAKADDPNMPAAAGVEGDVMWASRETFSGKPTQSEEARLVSRNDMAARIVGAGPEVETDNAGKSTAVFELVPGEKVSVYTVLVGGKDAETTKDDAISKVRELDEEAIEDLHEQHLEWWKDYWTKSYVRTYDDTLDQFYYGALYQFACVNRSGFTPAGQYPFCLSDDPAWAGDYHTNQEFLGQNEGLYSSNRGELLEGSLQVLSDFVPQAKEYAQTKMQTVHESFTEPRDGMLFPVGIGPWGVDSTVHDNGGEPWTGNMVSDASYTGMLMIWYYEYFQDMDWLREEGYPFVRELADFWVSHIKLIDEKDEEGKYVTYGAAWEESYGKNPIVDIALIKTVMDAAIEFSEELGVDAEMRATWRDIAQNMSDYPTAIQNGKEVFVEYEGKDSYRGGCDIQMIYPAEAISFTSDEKRKEIAYNSIDVNMEMTNTSFSKPFHTAVIATRMKYPIDKIVENLKSTMLETTISTWEGLRENFTIGGLHYNGEYLEFINSSMMQSHDGAIEIFPNWYKNRKAVFSDLRAKGAFLVSARQNEFGQVTEFSVTSEKASDCSIVNPWPGQKVEIYENGKKIAGEVSQEAIGEVYTFAAKEGANYKFKPEGGLQEMIRLDQTECQLQVGDTVTLKASTTTGASVQWSSDNHEVAMVGKEGGILAVRTGTAVIRAQVSEDAYALCEVRVSEKQEVNVAPLGRASADSTHEGLEPQRAISGDPGTGYARYEGWTSANLSYAENPQRWLQVDLGKECTIERWRLILFGYRDNPDQAGENERNWGDYALQVSENGVDSWKTVDLKEDNKANEISRTLSQPVTGRYFRVLIDLSVFTEIADYPWSSGFASINQLELYTTENPKEQTVAEVEAIDAISVAGGTAFERLKLPEEASVKLDNGMYVNVPVQWQEGNYHGNRAGEYVLSGTLDLPDIIQNPEGKTAQIRVKVIGNGQPENPENPENPGNSKPEKPQPGGSSPGASDGQQQKPEAASVKLKKKLKMGRKEKVTLTASVLPAGVSQKVTWKSSKKSVVAVSKNGKLKAKKTGKAIITATAENGKKASCVVTVKKEPKKIILKKKQARVKKGTSFRIKWRLPKGTGSYQMRFSSSKKTVAAVSSKGRVTAKKKGIAQIRIRTYNGKTAKLKVRVF